LIWSAGYERALLAGSVGIAVAALAAACYLARKTGDPHWINRGGAAITAAEGLIAVAEFRRRNRLSKTHRDFVRQMAKSISERETSLDIEEANELFEGEINRAERHVMLVAVSLAVAGELLHGFGDLIFEGFHSVLGL